MKKTILLIWQLKDSCTEMQKTGTEQYVYVLLYCRLRCLFYKFLLHMCIRIYTSYLLRVGLSQV